MITVKEFIAERDKKIFESFLCGDTQKTIAKEHGLSESRVKAICAKHKKLSGKSMGAGE